MPLRTRFADRPAMQSRGWGFMAGLGVLTLAAVGVLVYVGFNAPNAIPGRDYYTVQAAFNNADNLTGHYQVRVNGRIVGQVLDPRIEDGQAVVDLQMEPDVGPLPSDTKVEVRPRSPVGVRYVDITPGRSATLLAEGERIPSSQTAATVQLDEVLGTFDAPTRVRAQQFLRELGAGTAGRGEDLNAVLGRAPSTLRGLDSVAGALVERRGAAANLIRGTGVIATSLKPVATKFRDLFRPAADAVEPFADRRESVQRTLEVAPGTFSEVRAGLAATDPLVEQLRGLGRDVRPALRAAPGAMAQTSALLNESRPGLRAAEETLQTAGRAVDPTLQFLRTVKPVLPEVTATLTNAAPLVARLGQYGCDITAFGRGWSSIQGFGNDGGGVLRYNVTGGPESVYGFQPNYPGSRGAHEPRPEPCTVKQPAVDQRGR